MITLFVIVSLFITVKTFDVKELRVQKVKCEENVTIKCDSSSTKNKLVWYKQSFGKVPQLVVRLDSFKFSEEFHDGRFSISEDKNLNIKAIRDEDTGTYFCVDLQGSPPEFKSGNLVVVEAEEIKHPPQTVTVMENGESLTLQCSVQDFTSSCEEQSVYWFRHASGESHPGVIYTHGDGSDGCKKSFAAGSPTQSCVYTLPKRKITTSDNGLFYCAVATCGQILFGNGSKVEGTQVKENNHWIIVLMTSNIISVIVIMVLVGVLFKTQRKGQKASNNCSDNTNQTDDDILNYAAVSFGKKPSSSRATRDTSHQDIYSQVKIK